jgi:PucR C-terminal helix-turn-helix domain
MKKSDQPWLELPADIAAVLRPALNDVADEIIAAVRTVPAYARPMEGQFGVGVRAGVDEALRHFLAEIERGGPVARSDVYRTLGRGEVRAGRTLESLLSAYRVGARVAWRRFVTEGGQAGVAPETLYLLAESIFAYIDALSAESAEGYALEQSAAASEAELRRRRLVRLLLREPPADAAAVEAASAEALWQLPHTLAVIAVPAERARGATLRLSPGALLETIGELTCVVVPDPDGPGRRRELERAVREAGLTGGMGTTVPWQDAGLSFARARAALDLATDPGLVVARERAGDLLLRSDRRLARELALDRLAPLQGVKPGPRRRLTATLSAWLAKQGRLGAVATRLGVHPQTARYRLARLRDVFGDALDDPDERFWLEVALRIEAGPVA